MSNARILAFVLAGGQDLHPVTSSRARSAMSLGGYRLVDFALSNLVNSGIEAIYVLAGEDAEILEGHIRDHWSSDGNEQERFIRVVRTGCGVGEAGAAGVLWRNIHLVEQHAPDLVAICAGDQVCRMDLRQMVGFHQEREAEVTVAAAPVLMAQASRHDVIVAGCNGEVWHVQERPEIPMSIPFDPAYAYAAMGSQLFNANVLIESLEERARQRGEGVGQGFLSRVASTREVFAYDFSGNRVPGAHLADENYWRNIDTLQAYIDATQDVDGLSPRVRLHNPHWPMLPLQGVAAGEAGMKHAAWLAKFSVAPFDTRLVYH